MDSITFNTLLLEEQFSVRSVSELPRRRRRQSFPRSRSTSLLVSLTKISLLSLHRKDLSPLTFKMRRPLFPIRFSLLFPPVRLPSPLLLRPNLLPRFPRALDKLRPLLFPTRRSRLFPPPKHPFPTLPQTFPLLPLLPLLSQFPRNRLLPCPHQKDPHLNLSFQPYLPLLPSFKRRSLLLHLSLTSSFLHQSSLLAYHHLSRFKNLLRSLTKPLRL